jgi:hypothetical protein
MKCFGKVILSLTQTSLDPILPTFPYLHLKMKFASVTSDAFFNVLKSAKKNSIQCPSENIERVKEVKLDDYDRGC